MGKRRAGKAGGSGGRRESLLQVRLEGREKETFEAAAALAGIGLSSWVRERLRRAAIRELEEAGRPNPLFAEDGGEQE